MVACQNVFVIQYVKASHLVEETHDPSSVPNWKSHPNEPSKQELNMTSPSKEILRTFVFSAYDLQMLRMQTGLRLCANFRSKLQVPQEGTEEEEVEAGELTKEAQTIIDRLTASYKRLTDGVARNRLLPAEKGFVGDELITTYTELVLVNQYIQVEKNEQQQFRQFEAVLSNYPIYETYLKDQVGIGPALAAVLLAYFDPHKADHISDFWAYAGLDVARDGRGRSRRAEHLIDRPYKNKEGQEATRKSVTYNPWLKARLLGVMAGSFLRVKDSPWRIHYDNYKHRIITDPARRKTTLAEYKKLHKEDPSAARDVWPPLRVHRAAMRYMVKMFLADLWLNWRKIEGLPVTPTYHEAKLGHVHSRGTDSGPRSEAAE